MMARLTYEAQQALSDKLIEALENKSLDKADIFQKIIKGNRGRKPGSETGVGS